MKVWFWDACKVRKNTYNMLLFLSYLLNDSQTIQFSKLRLCMTLICSDWPISFKAERSVTLCTALPGKPLQHVGGKYANVWDWFYNDSDLF